MAISLKSARVEKYVTSDLAFNLFVGSTSLHGSHQWFKREGRSLDVKKRTYQSSLVKIQVTCLSSLLSSQSDFCDPPFHAHQTQVGVGTEMRLRNGMGAFLL